MEPEIKWDVLTVSLDISHASGNLEVSYMHLYKYYDVFIYTCSDTFSTNYFDISGILNVKLQNMSIKHI